MSSVPDDFSRSQLKDRKWKGEGVEMNKDIARTPTEKSRRCTDLLCCLVFLAFFVGMVWATIYGYINGNPGKLIAPIDGDGSICGYSTGYENYPKLYIGDIIEAAADAGNVFQFGVCVTECPANADDSVDCMTTTKVSTCTSPGEGYGTNDVLNYCRPIYDTLPPQAQANYDSVKAEAGEGVFGGAFAELLESRWVILIAAAIAIVVTMIYIKFMDWCAFWLSWVSVFLVLFTFVGSGTYAYIYRQDKIESNPSFEDDSTATWLNFYAWTAWIFAGFYLLYICCNFQSLRVAIAVIETAADYFADTKRIILVPVLYFIAGILMFVAWAGAMICVSSIGEITAGNVELQTKNIEWDSMTSWSVVYMIFGFIWLTCFLIACNEFVVIVSAITWYYSDKEEPDDDGIPGDSDVKMGFWWSVRYHMGSLAFGSFLLAIVWIIRMIFEYVGEKMHEAIGENGCTKCVFSCVRCCLDCFDRFVRYINRNAYIYMALSGEGFCSSALNSFILILKNHAKFAFVDGIADMFMFLAKFFISSVTTALSWLLLGAMTEVNSPFFPLFMIFLLSYMIASIFIAIFDISANTILQCYLMDKEVQKQLGVVEDPKHVPPTMAKFFKHPAVMEKMNTSASNTLS